MKRNKYTLLSDGNKDLNPKEYLQQNAIDFESILRQPALYYPGAGGDFDPFKLFSQHSIISTVIYCDYSCDHVRSVLKNDIYRKLKNYRVISIKRIEPDILGCRSWQDFWPLDPEANTIGNCPAGAFGLLVELRFKSNNKVVNFVYLCTEAIKTYKILFSDRKISPAVVVIQDHGLGGGWTAFGGKDSKLYKIAKPALPNFLYANGKVWPGYDRVSCEGDGEGMHSNKRALYIQRGTAGLRNGRQRT